MSAKLLITACLWIFGFYLPQLHSATIKESQYFVDESERLKVFVDIIKESTNPEVNPCIDYLGYTSGNLTSDIALHTAPARLFKLFFDKNIKNNEDLDLLNGEKQMKTFFESCYNNLPKTFKQSVKNIDFKDIGHFPVLEENWREDQFSWINTDAKLQSYGMYILLEAHARKSDDGFYVFTLAPADNFDLDMWLTSQPGNEFEIILEALGLTSDAIQKLKNDFMELESKLTALYDIDIKADSRKTIRWLQDTIPKIDWIKYFSIVASDAVNDTNFLDVVMSETIKSVIDLVENTDKRLLANYYIYRIYRNLYNEFDRVVKYKERCYNIAYEYFKGYVPNLVLEKYYDEHDLINLNNSLEIANEIKSDLQKQGYNSTGLEINKKYLQRLQKIFQNRLNNPKYTTNYYDGIDLHKSDFFKNCIQLKMLNNQKLLKINQNPNFVDILGLHQTFSKKTRVYQSFIFSVYPYTVFFDEKNSNLSQTCQIKILIKKVLELFTKAISLFKEHNEEWFSKEQEFFAKHDLTYNKIFFTLFAHSYEPHGDDPMQILLGIDEFVNDYQCPAENEIVKDVVKSY